MLKLEAANTSDPEEFWLSIQSMGRKPKKNIPEQVYDAQGEVTDNLDEVLTRWMTDFESLLTPPEKTDEERLLYEHIKKINRSNEALNNMRPDREYNNPFEDDEVRKAVLGAKNKKATGIDGLVYEAFKNNLSIKVLTQLFNYCLASGLLPTTWLQAIISPIPKSSSSDPKIPLNYRGISLLPVTSKLYSGLLAQRVGGYLEKGQVLVNKQNGFRPDRSCVDHIFTLCDLLRIRKEAKLETFCGFIDLFGL